jgi:ribose 5-phosphate isomerase RpiB
MKIAIASDRVGFPLKEEVRDYVARLGHDIIGAALAFECVDVYLKANFIGSEPRFVRRLNKVKRLKGSTYNPSLGPPWPLSRGGVKTALAKILRGARKSEFISQ